MATLRFLFGPGFAPAEVWFEHAAPPDVAEMRALIGITPSYSRPYNTIAIDRALLDHPVPNHDPALLSILERHALELLAQRSDPSSLGARVRGVLADRLRDGAPSMDEVARSLGTSASTMRRRLSEEGTTFADELDAVRRALAERYLLDPQLSVSAIAFLLGFSEASAFTRAFRRWHRTTPKAYRRAHLG